MDDAIDPIDDDELLYRRIPTSTDWYDPSLRELTPQAFAPHKKRDTSGLSVSRAKYKSIEEAARGRPGKSYYVAVLRAGDLRNCGINAIPRPKTPDGFDKAHAELPDLNAANHDSDETISRQRLLAEELCLRVEGPYLTPDL